MAPARKVMQDQDFIDAKNEVRDAFKIPAEAVFGTREPQGKPSEQGELREVDLDEIVQDLKEGDFEGALRKQTAAEGRNMDELDQPEAQKAIKDTQAVVKLFKSGEQPTSGELDEAAKMLQKVPKLHQKLVRATLRLNGVDDDVMQQLLPDKPIVGEAPISDAADSNGLEPAPAADGQPGLREAPTQGGEDEQLTQEQIREIGAVPVEIDKLIGDGNMDGAKKLAKGALKLLGKGTWKTMKISYYVALTAYIIYIGLMAKTGNALGKK
mgnify:CR=1 FL=1